MMNRIFSFQKNAKLSFEKKEEHLAQIKMPDIDRKSVCIVDESPTGYGDPRWIEKSNSIKARDNYTCQLCHAFNPMLGEFVFIRQGEYDTIHHYYWAGHNIYEIQVQGYILNVTFDFMPGFYLAMPRLNVHHKIYYRNRDLWDYNDDDLVTLCEDCHHYIHSLDETSIPIVEVNADGKAILIGKTSPKPYQLKLDHTDLGTFKPLALVEENRWGYGLNESDLAVFRQAKNVDKQWFDYHKLLTDKVVQIRHFTAENPHISKHTPEEAKKVAEFIINDFIENILGFSIKEQ